MANTIKNPARLNPRLPLGIDGAKAFGARIRAARLASDLRLDDLAELSGVHRSQISRIERGVALTLTPKARRLCECLGLPLPLDEGNDTSAALTAQLAGLLHQHPLAAKDVKRALAIIEKRYLKKV